MFVGVGCPSLLIGRAEMFVNARGLFVVGEVVQIVVDGEWRRNDGEEEWGMHLSS